MNNLINQTTEEICKVGLENMTPLERLMWYRNSDLIDIDRGAIAQNSYKKQGFYLNETMEPDTFFISAYNDLTKMLKNYDKCYYIDSFKIYIERLGINYELLSKFEANYYRKKWFVLESTIEKYSHILENNVVNDYIAATHVLGNFMIIPKGHGWIKCRDFNDKGVQYLSYLQENWESYRESFSNISFKEYVQLSKIQDLYDENFEIKEIYLIDYQNDDWEVTLEKMKSLTQFVTERNRMLIE